MSIRYLLPAGMKETPHAIRHGEFFYGILLLHVNYMILHNNMFFQLHDFTIQFF